MTKKKRPECKNKVGRPTVVTPEIVQKLENAFSIGCTDIEACLEADISRGTYYNYVNAHPEFIDRKEELIQAPFLKARKTIVSNLHTPDVAEWYLERKGKSEFGTKTSVEYSNADAEGITNAEIIKNAFLALPPEERKAIVSEVNQLNTPPEGSTV